MRNIERCRSDLAKAYYANPENRAKQSARMKEVANSKKHGHKFVNRVISDETKQKIRESVNKFYEKSNAKWNEEGRNKHSEVMSKLNGRKIAKYNRKGQLIQIYNTIKDAAEANDMKRTTLSAIVRNNRMPPGDYVWKYADIQGLKDTSQ